MTRSFDIPMNVAVERVYRFQAAYEAEREGYAAEITLHADDTPYLLQSPARMGTVSFAIQAALDCVARDVGHTVRVEQVMGATEYPFWVGMWVVEAIN